MASLNRSLLKEDERKPIPIHAVRYGIEAAKFLYNVELCQPETLCV